MHPVEIPCGYSQSMPQSHQDWWYRPGASHLQQLGLSRDITDDTMGLSPNSCCIFDAMDCHGPFGTLLSVLELLQLFAKRVPRWHQLLALWSFLPQRQLENWRKSSTYCLKVWAWECLTAKCLQNHGWLLGVGSWTFVSSTCFFYFSAIDSRQNLPVICFFFLSGSVWLPVCNMLALESPMCPVLATFWCSYPRIPNFFFLSFLFISPFLPLFLPLFLPSFIPSFLPFSIPSFLPFFLSSLLPVFIHSVLPSLLASFLLRKKFIVFDPKYCEKIWFGEWDWSNFSFPHLRFIVSLCSFVLNCGGVTIASEEIERTWR